MAELEHGPKRPGPTPRVTEQALATELPSGEGLGSKRASEARKALSQRLWTASLTFLLRLVLCACPVFVVLFSGQPDGDLLTTQSIWLVSGGLAALGILLYEGLAFWRGVKSFPQEWLAFPWLASMVAVAFSLVWLDEQRYLQRFAAVLLLAASGYLLWRVAGRFLPPFRSLWGLRSLSIGSKELEQRLGASELDLRLSSSAALDTHVACSWGRLELRLFHQFAVIQSDSGHLPRSNRERLVSSCSPRLQWRRLPDGLLLHGGSARERASAAAAVAQAWSFRPGPELDVEELRGGALGVDAASSEPSSWRAWRRVLAAMLGLAVMMVLAGSMVIFPVWEGSLLTRLVLLVCALVAAVLGSWSSALGPTSFAEERALVLEQIGELMLSLGVSADVVSGQREDEAYRRCHFEVWPSQTLGESGICYSTQLSLRPGGEGLEAAISRLRELLQRLAVPHRWDEAESQLLLCGRSCPSSMSPWLMLAALLRGDLDVQPRACQRAFVPPLARPVDSEWHAYLFPTHLLRWRNRLSYLGLALGLWAFPAIDGSDYELGSSPEQAAALAEECPDATGSEVSALRALRCVANASGMDDELRSLDWSELMQPVGEAIEQLQLAVLEAEMGGCARFEPLMADGGRLRLQWATAILERYDAQRWGRLDFYWPKRIVTQHPDVLWLGLARTVSSCFSQLSSESLEELRRFRQAATAAFETRPLP